MKNNTMEGRGFTVDELFDEVEECTKNGTNPEMKQKIEGETNTMEGGLLSIKGNLCSNPETHYIGSLPCCAGIYSTVSNPKGERKIIFRWRDILALPFFLLGVSMLTLCGRVGGVWTARELLKFINQKPTL